MHKTRLVECQANLFEIINNYNKNGYPEKIFGTRRDEAWRQFSEGINRKYIEGKFPHKEIRIEIKHMAWGMSIVN